MVFKGLFGLFKNGLWPFLWLVCGWLCELVCDCLWNVQKKNLGVVWMKRKIRIVKGLFGKFYGQLKGLFYQFLCLVKGLLWLFCDHFTCHTLP